MKTEYERIYAELGGRTEGGHGPDTWDETVELYDAVVRVGPPCHILEIGFNNGGSALAFLLAGARVTSVDVKRNDQSIEALTRHFGDQFHFVQIQDRSGELSPETFDLAFIDGNHDREPVERDIEDCLQLNIPYLLFHDTLHGGYPHIKEIIDRYVNEGRFTIVREYTTGCGKTLVTVNDMGA
jgi:predicted O-methyltransferase YrrM